MFIWRCCTWLVLLIMKYKKWVFLKEFGYNQPQEMPVELWGLQWHISIFMKKKRKKKNEDSMSRSLLGPSYEDNQIQKFLEDFGLNYDLLINDIDLVNQTVEVKEGKFIGFFQGRMEYGPRSLGSRSILADPRGTEVQKN